MPTAPDNSHSAPPGEAPEFSTRIALGDLSVEPSPPEPWMAFFLRLGHEVASGHCSGHKLTAVAIPPSRAFAAGLSATGAVVAVAQAGPSLPGPNDHFQALSRLEPSTRVVVVMGRKTYAGEFLGIVERPEGLMVRVEYAGMTHYIPRDSCQKVQVGSGGKKTLPATWRARSQDPEARVIAKILGEGVSKQFLATPTVDVVLIGQVSTLEEELTRLSISSVSEARQGSSVRLAAILRPTRLLSDGAISRSMLISDRSAEFEPPVADVPHVAVFDGARAFSRYRSEFPDSSWIVILDRCSPRLREGVDVANNEYAMRRSTHSLARLAVPPGTEVQVFERR